MKKPSPKRIKLEDVTGAIVTIRSTKVILDADLAALYGVSTGQFNRSVRRNLERFPTDFMFQLTPEEARAISSQNAALKSGRGGRRYAPLAFTEHGAIMAATILNTSTATEVSVFVVRAFIRFREALTMHAELAARVTQLEEWLAKKLSSHDHAIDEILHAIRRLTTTPATARRPIGFVRPEE